MALIFICSPYASRGSIPENIIRAQRMCKKALAEGNSPIAPHLIYPQILDDSNPTERALGLKASKNVIKHCKAFWIAPGPVTGGMKPELMEAEKQGLYIYQLTEKDLKGFYPKEV